MGILRRLRPIFQNILFASYTYVGEPLAEDGSGPAEVGGELCEGDAGAAVRASADTSRGDHFSVHTKHMSRYCTSKIYA